MEDIGIVNIKVDSTIGEQTMYRYMAVCKREGIKPADKLSAVIQDHIIETVRKNPPDKRGD